MENLRGEFEPADDYGEETALPEERADDSAPVREEPPCVVGQDERRMQVRAYNHWAGLLGDRKYPAIEDLEPETLPDFGPHSVLLDFGSGIEDPAIQFLGEKLAAECDGDGEIERLSDVPSRSLLSRITDHYMQILANQAPIGFEAEFVNRLGHTVLYRGILLPYSSDDDTIDFIYGVINWKELADQATTDALMLEVEQALEEGDEARRPERDAAIEDWADGPTDIAAPPVDGTPDRPEPSVSTDYSEPHAIPSGYSGDEDAGDVWDEEDEGSDFADGFATGLQGASSYAEEDEDLEDEDDFASLGGLGLGRRAGAQDASPSNDALPRPSFGLSAPEPEPDREPLELDRASEVTEIDLPEEPAPEDMGLADWLASAREMAQAARSSEDRTRTALYDAIGRAYDFSLAAEDDTQEFDALMEEAGLTRQDRAPMTPVVKLVFGADYDKTRLTEYAAALGHAHRLDVPRGELSHFLKTAEGGLKGVVREERRLRREEAGKPVEPRDAPRTALAEKLRAMAPQGFDAVDPEGAEFGLVMIRRLENGQVVMLGEVPDDVALVERAARKLVG